MPLLRRHISRLILVGISLTLVGTLHAGDFRIEIISLYQNATLGRGFEPSVSDDGRRIAFESTQRLTPSDTISYKDIYVRDRATNQTILVSASNTGAPGVGNSYLPTISGNGRYVVFFSFASNFYGGDTPSTSDLFVRDLETGTTFFVAPADYLNNDPPDITPDGRYIVFTSDTNNLVTGDSNNQEDIFRYDLQTNQFALVNAVGGTPGNNRAEAPVISDDGRYIYFHSNANNLVTGDTNNTIDVFRRDMQSAEIVRVSVSNASVQGNGPSTYASTTSDGRYVAFQSQAGNLVSFATGATQIIIRDMQLEQNTLISVTPDGLDDGNGVSSAATITDDGRFVAFSSMSSNLVSPNNASTTDIFVRDLQANLTTQVNLTEAGGQPTSGANSPDISPDGGSIVFYSSAELVDGGSFDTLYLASNIFLPNASPFNAVPEPDYFDALPVTLTWNAISWAEEYEIQVADNAAFVSATSYYAAVGILEYDLTTLENDTYYWRVRARDAADVWGSWSAVQTFEVEAE